MDSEAGTLCLEVDNSASATAEDAGTFSLPLEEDLLRFWKESALFFFAFRLLEALTSFLASYKSEVESLFVVPYIGV